MPGVPAERIAALDVVRGVAVGGILLANILVFFGLMFAPTSIIASMPTAAIDATAQFVGHVLVEGKFYSVFSLLFGIGFGVQLARGGDGALPRFRRRLWVLVLIGAAHALLIWAGDILLLYALLGFTLPWFARRSDRALLQWVLGLLAAPTVLYLFLVVVLQLSGGVDSPGATGELPTSVMARFEAMGRGGVVDAWRGNLIFFVGRWIDLVISVRPPKVLGMFVLGLWLVRKGIALAPHLHRPLLVRWSLIGLGIGLPANLAAAWLMADWPYMAPSPGALAAVTLQGLGVPLLALGYAATLALLVVDGRRGVGAFAPVGRMALTNYLMQSIIGVTLSYGFGIGLWWRVGAATAMAIAVAVFVVQIVLSAWWLSRHPMGPMEWAWRRLSRGSPLT